MPDALTLYTGDNLTRSRQWASLPLDERKRRAAEACACRDVAALWDLTLSYWFLYGAAGARVSPNSIAAYKRGVTVFVTDTARTGHSIMRFPRDGAAVWVREQEAAGLKTSTIQVRLAAARMLYRALRWCNVTDTDPLADIKPSRDPTPAYSKRGPYSDSDVERLLNVCTDAHDRVLVLLGAHGGCRIAEMLSLTWEDVDLSDRLLVIQHGKGGKRREITVSGQLSKALSQICAPLGPILPYRTRQTAAQHMKRLCGEAGIRYRALHSLRHSCGTKLIRSGLSMEDAARHLGHSSIEITRTYVHWSNEALDRTVSEW